MAYVLHYIGGKEPETLAFSNKLYSFQLFSMFHSSAFKLFQVSYLFFVSHDFVWIIWNVQRWSKSNIFVLKSMEYLKAHKWSFNLGMCPTLCISCWERGDNIHISHNNLTNFPIRPIYAVTHTVKQIMAKSPSWRIDIFKILHLS